VTFNHGVAGSNPAGLANIENYRQSAAFRAEKIATAKASVSARPAVAQ
jgi:hypothetical protein